MSRQRRAARATLAFAIVLGSLAAVAWRQSTARATMRELDRVERELALAIEEREELERELAGMETRPRIGAEAARRLGMRAPAEHEVVIASGGAR